MSFNQHLSSTPEDERDLAQTPWNIIQDIEKALHVRLLLDVCAFSYTKKAPYFIGEFATDDPCQIGTDMFSLNWAETLSNLCTLDIDWCGPGRTQAAFMNPPFSLFERAFAEAVVNADRGAWVVTTCKHDESTDWWNDYVRKRASFVLKPKRRIAFLRPNGEPFMTVNKRNGKLEKVSPPFYSVFPVFTPFKLRGGPVEILI